MNNPRYHYKSESNFEYFEFYSEGPNGIIKKVIEYQKTNDQDVYNLAFGDYDETTQGINDLKVTNNGDSLKVLSTVASTVYIFIDKHPDAIIIAAGSTDSRTRLYRMGITKNLDEISRDFIIFGFTNRNSWEEFEVGFEYQAFLITKKSNQV
jgi:hypothetical protein